MQLHLGPIIPRDSFRVLLLHGSGSAPCEDTDAGLVSSALAELGYREGVLVAATMDRSDMTDSVQGANLSSVQRRTGGKYDPLEDFLRALPIQTREISLTFQEIERLLGFQLPASSMKYREWWSNQTDVSGRPQARAWTNAGFRIETVRQHSDNSWVKFIRH